MNNDLSRRWTLEQALQTLDIDIQSGDLAKLRDEYYDCLEEHIGEYVSVKRDMTIASGKVIQKTQAVVDEDIALAQAKNALKRWIKSEWQKAESRRQVILDETTLRLNYLEDLSRRL